LDEDDLHRRNSGEPLVPSDTKATVISLADKEALNAEFARHEGELKQILSVSRRTDIPAFYMAWFMDQVPGIHRGGQSLQPASQAGGISPESGFTPWCSGPKTSVPFLAGRCGERLQAMGYHLLFNFTVNSRSPILEPGVPDLNQRLTNSGSFAIGSEARRSNGASIPSATSPRKQAPSRPIWMISKPSLQQPAACEIGTCTTSFMDHYRKIERRTRDQLSLSNRHRLNA
jgi:hypothetical protein